jgi:hypothetical protein
LDAIATGKALTADQQSQLNFLADAAKPKAQLLLIPMLAVQKLVAAATGPPTLCTTYAKP